MNVDRLSDRAVAAGRDKPCPYECRARFVMCCEGESRCGDETALFERADLTASIELILGGDVRAADELARLLDSFRQAMDEGLHGIEDARVALRAAVELVYLRTGAHASALKLYRLSLEGHALPGDEPDALLNAAIARSARSVRAARGKS